ncbi:SDR family NAD(P)-dependent oxidoreductase [Kineococcus gynurae]|uniref:SDR family NAD(P)-dependent oxidoreductase n=1 Tax=Kineococcus gynurae TaxID=452979 RepID=A0ABV5LQU3_9ACTN
MDLGLGDRVYLVSNVTSLLGSTCARTLADEGALLVLTDADEDQLAELAPSIGERDRMLLVPGDLTDAGTETRLVAAANARFGRLDGAIISCGGGDAPEASTLAEAPDTLWRENFERGLLAPVRLARTVGRIATGEGASIVLTLASTVHSPVGGAGVANGLRPGLSMAGKTLADELGPRGVRVNSVLCGAVDDGGVDADFFADEGADSTLDAVPLRRRGQPEEFARAAVFLISPAASFITGTALTVDGGQDRVL